MRNTACFVAISLIGAGGALPGGTALAADVVPLEGQSSLIAPLAPRSLLLDGVVADGRMMVVGDRGHVLISDDGGSTWVQSVTPTRTMLTGVWLADKNHGWAVGHDTLILKTTDGGATWARVYSAPEDEQPLFDVWFDDASNGIAIGAYGLFMTTADGGASWDNVGFDPVPYEPETDQAAGDEEESDEADADDEFADDEFADDDLPFDYHLNQIADAPNGMLYIAGEAGNFFRSRDRGESWEWLTPPYDGSFFGVLPLEGDALLLFGMRGNLFRSEDAGDTWETVDTGTQATLNMGARLSDGRIVIAGMQGVLLISTDDGHSFTEARRPDRKHVAGVLTGGSGAAVAFGESGVYRLTGDLQSAAAPN